MRKKDKKTLFLGMITLGLLLLMNYIYPSQVLKIENRSHSITIANRATNNFVYLSDMNYITENNWSFNGWSGHDIQINKNQSGGTIGLYVDGENRTFTKGIGLHAKGQIVYDISAYSTTYPRFITYLGLDSSKSGSIWFKVDVSNDGTVWDTVVPRTVNLTNTSNAIKVDVNVSGYKYLKIYVDPNGSNASDHGNIADAKLVTEDYVDLGYPYTKIHKLDYYDKIINAHDVDYNLNNNYHLVLEREVVNKLGFWNLQYAYETIDNFDEIMSWILSSDRILENVIEVGNISDTSKFLTVLNDLYVKYKDCLTEKDGYVYEKMMIALATAYSTDYIHNPHNYGFHAANYDYIERFRLVKKMYDEDLIPNTEARPYKTWFKNYQMELMRMVMQDFVRDDETLWLNYYIKNYRNYNVNSTTLVPYGKFNIPFSTYNDEANYNTFNSKYHFSEYNELFPDEQIPYGDNPNPLRYWMYFSGRGICWRISRIGQSLTRSLGLPATGTYQPQHESYLAYSQDTNGNGIWTIWNNIGGWGRASTSWGGSKQYRVLFDWGNKSYAWSTTGGNSTAYILLGQANLNHYETYKKSLYINLVANSYSNNSTKAEAYKKALDINNLNLESYEYLIKTYKNIDSITDDDWMELVDKIIDAYTYYPNAMYDLITKLILPQVQDGAKKTEINLKVKKSLNKAYVATNNEILQPIQTQQVAASLLGHVNEQIATFSFDGEHAKEIVLSAPYDTYNFSWNYSLDGGNTWSKSVGDTTSIKIPDDEISEITAENDIKIHIDGLEGVAYTIDITEGTIRDNLYANDFENRVIGRDDTYEWRMSGTENWISYKEALPDLTGNKTIELRVGFTSTKLPSPSRTFNFTEDNQPDTRKYIPIVNYEVVDFVSQSKDTKRPNYALNAIDGNAYTEWHTDYTASIGQGNFAGYITIKLNKPRYVSGIDYLHLDTDAYGYMKDAKVYVSNDNENWTEAGAFVDVSKDNELKVFTFERPVYGQYVKLAMNSYDNVFATAAMINIYEDCTKVIDDSEITAGIEYSTSKITNGDVVARLVNVNRTNYSIISEGGDTHTFTENGEWIFMIQDNDTNKIGKITARVSWIDKNMPIGTITYDTTKPTNNDVIATLKTNKDVKIMNNGYYEVRDGKAYDYRGQVIEEYTVEEIRVGTSDITGEQEVSYIVKDGMGEIVDPFTYQFFENGEFTFEFIDEAGNVGRATAKVNLIDFDKPEGSLSYSTTSLTNKNVTVTVDSNEEIVVTNNSGSKSYTFKENGEFTFEFKDLAGNTNQITAKVDWIDKTIPSASLKYERKDNKVIVYVVNPSEKITFKEGYGVYEFTKNGNYDIYFYDHAKNVGKVTAIITGLKEETKDPNTDTNTNTANNSSNKKPETNTIYIRERKKTTKNTTDKYDETIEDSNQYQEKLEEEKPFIEDEELDKKKENKNDKKQNREIKDTENQNYIIPVMIGIALVFSVIIFIVKRIHKL